MPPVEPSIEGYHSLLRIGRGGLGDVYRATRAATGETVAIKILRDVVDPSVTWRRTRREVAALGALAGHANVVQHVELLEFAHGPALAMEYAPGGSVAELTADRDAQGGHGLRVDEAVFVGRQTAAALEAAHAVGIVHRDIKPQNLLIDADGQVKLCDFGIAALTADEDYRTRTGAVSMRYASPEDLEHDELVGPQSDVYSLGATLLHLVHGAPPTLKQRLEPWIPPPTDDARLAALDRVIARCLHPRPAERPTARDLRHALDRLALGADRVSALPVRDRHPLPSASDAPPPGMAFDDEPAIDRDALTVDRPRRNGDPPPPRPARPSPYSPPGRRAVLLGAGAATTAVIAVLAVSAFRPGGGSAIPETLPVSTSSLSSLVTVGPETAPRPQSLAPLVGADWSAGEVSDCLAQIHAALTLAVVDCAQPHDLQRFASGSLGAAPLAEFVAADVERAALSACHDAFPRFVGTAAGETRLDIAVTRPSAASWLLGDRAYHCFLGTEGGRLVGDARTSGW